ncbi:MAG: dienelactone hydrolase family protein [Acidobacteriota bacterium]
MPELRQRVRHLVFTPSNYSADGQRRWPLIVGLHGTAGNPEQVMEFQRLRELAERYGYLLVCPFSSGVGELHQSYVLEVLADTRDQYRVDPERVFLMGFSRGGAGVWGLGAAHPELWAGLAPISPATPQDPKPLDRMSRLPTIVVLGDRDDAVSQGAVRRWVQRMGELDMPHQFVELPGLGHDLSRVNFLPAVFEFFERQARQ